MFSLAGPGQASLIWSIINESWPSFDSLTWLTLTNHTNKRRTYLDSPASHQDTIQRWLRLLKPRRLRSRRMKSPGWWKQRPGLWNIYNLLCTVSQFCNISAGGSPKLLISSKFCWNMHFHKSVWSSYVVCMLWVEQISTWAWRSH